LLADVKECIAAGVIVEAKTEGGWTALLLASFEGHLEIVQYLLQNGNANVDVKANDGWTALHFASNARHLEIVRYLLQNGNANVDAQENDGRTALHYASDNGYLEMIQYLLQNGNANAETKTNNGFTALHFASRNAHLKVVQYLLQNGNANVDAQENHGWTALHFASDNGDLEIVLYLVHQCQANVYAVTKNNKTPLDVAKQAGKTEIVDYLSAWQSTPDLEERFRYAAQHGLLADVNECIAAGVNVEAKTINGWTALHFASINGHLEIVQYLLQNGNANVNAQKNDGWTALHFASSNGHLEIVQYLVQQCQANVRAVTKNNETPLDVAKQTGKTEIVEYLSVRQITPEEIILSVDDMPVSIANVKECFTAGVNVEKVTEDRSTSLHLACSFAQKYCFRADIDFELNALQILIDDGLQVHATVAAMEAAFEAEEHKEALLVLCQTDDYATVESLQQQLEKVKLDIEKSHTLSERIPYAKQRDELQK
jgi:ankyrin repeat protein